MTPVRSDIDPAAWLDGIRLGHGSHPSPDDGLCVMEAVAYLAGEPHTDRPACVSPVLGAFLRSWNDALSDHDRQVLKPYALLVIGTADDGLDEVRSWLAVDWLIRVHTPAWLRLAGLDVHAEALEQSAPVTAATIVDIRPRVVAARAAAGDAAGDVVWSVAGDAARSAAEAAAGDVVWSVAGDAAGDAARSAAGAAAGAVVWSVAGDAARSAARVAAWSAAGAAAGADLGPTTRHLQLSALGLLEHLIDPTKDTL